MGYYENCYIGFSCENKNLDIEKIKELIEVALKNGYNDLVNAIKNAYNIL